ncbi:MAG: hypothetical protein WAX07_10200 [Candidatus Altiarchaeia archaeon]
MELTKGVIDEYIIRKIGPQVYANDYSRVEKDAYRIAFGVAFPEIIKNYTDGEEEHLRYVKFDNVGTYDYNFDGSLKPKSRFDRMELYTKAYKKRYELSLDTEAIVLDATYRYLAKLSLVKTNLNPIYSILTKINKNDSANPANFRINQRKYFDLLESQHLIRKTKGKEYERGNAYIEIEKLIQQEKEQDVITYVVGYALKDGKKYFIEHLRLTSIVPFLRIANTYYSLALRAQQLIYTTTDELMLEHKRLYNTGLGAQFKTKFENHLHQIATEAEIIEEGKYLHGKTKIFKDLQERARGIPAMKAIGY